MRLHTVLGPALVALSLSGLRRLRGRGARRLRARDLPALLGREDVLVLDTETTGLGRNAEVIEVVAIDTTGAVRASALSFPFGPISRGSRAVHGLNAEALHAMGARPWPEVHPALVPVLREAKHVLAWRADFDARVLEQTAAFHNLALPPVRWADVRPAYADARGRHSLAGAMRREGLAWEGRHHRAEADCRAVLAVMRAIARAGLAPGSRRADRSSDRCGCQRRSENASGRPV